jgi:hypothetical protein
MFITQQKIYMSVFVDFIFFILVNSIINFYNSPSLYMGNVYSTKSHILGECKFSPSLFPTACDFTKLTL